MVARVLQARFLLYTGVIIVFSLSLRLVRTDNFKRGLYEHSTSLIALPKGQYRHNDRVIIENDIETDLSKWTKNHIPQYLERVEHKEVCVFTSRYNQASLFLNKQLEFYGTGSLRYIVVDDSSKCKEDHPRIYLKHIKRTTISRIKARRKINIQVYTPIPADFIGLRKLRRSWDIVVLTGDEFCFISDENFHFRQYYSDTVISNTFMPLGSRHEFKIVNENELLYERKFEFNLVASLTSKERKDLRDFLINKGYITYTSKTRQKKLRIFKSFQNSSAFVHLVEKWTESGEGYLNATEYRQVLLQSKFTLCPTGHNRETYRIYEAAMAGSIPVLFNDESYKQSGCVNSYKPFIDKNAPFIYIRSYNELVELLRRAQAEPSWVNSQRIEVLNWISTFMSKFAIQFERQLNASFNQRMRIA